MSVPMWEPEYAVQLDDGLVLELSRTYLIGEAPTGKTIDDWGAA